MKRNIIIAIIALFLAGLGIALYLFYFNQQSFADCKKEKDPNILGECISNLATEKIKASDKNPANVIIEINAEVNRVGGSEMAAICHISMHKTGRDFALRENVTLGDLQKYVPRSNSPDCPSGFTHGILSAIVADVTDNKKMLNVCASQKTQAQQFSCSHGIGHSFRRTFANDNNVRESINGCRTLGRDAASDCSQGVYHDYMLAIKGYDDTYKPKNGDKAPLFCLDQPEDFQKECWFRLFLILGSPVKITDAQSIGYACESLRGRKRIGCLAGLATKELKLEKMVDVCSKLHRKDAGACISGGNLVAPDFLVEEDAQTIEKYRRRTYIPLIAECSSMPSQQDKKDCGYWLAYRSMRELPVAVSYQKAKIICLAGEKSVAEQCRKGIKDQIETIFIRS